MGIWNTINDIPEILAILFWPDYTQEEWEAFNFWRLALAFTIGTVVGMATLSIALICWPFVESFIYSF